MTNEILLGDCEGVLPSFADNSVDSLISDVPYGLGKIPAWGDIERYLAGAGSLGTGDFMGSDWELPTIGALREMYRVLKPGGHCLIFSSTRTFDIMAAGLVKAGFQYQGVRSWTFGSGFPKSSNLSKQADKRANAARTVVGVKPGHEAFVGRDTEGHLDFTSNSALGGFDRPWMHDPEKREQYHMETAPATDDAKKWAGWGSALKPAWEPILVFSKGDPKEPLGGPLFFYSAKSNRREKTLEGEITNTHPTVKSLSLMRKLVALACPPGGVVLDPYVGSGTTAEAAIREGRRYVAIEKFPQWYDVACKRLAAVDGSAGADARAAEDFEKLIGGD